MRNSNHREERRTNSAHVVALVGACRVKPWRSLKAERLEDCSVSALSALTAPNRVSQQDQLHEIPDSQSVAPGCSTSRNRGNLSHWSPFLDPQRPVHERTSSNTNPACPCLFPHPIIRSILRVRVTDNVAEMNLGFISDWQVRHRSTGSLFLTTNVSYNFKCPAPPKYDLSETRTDTFFGFF